MADSFITTNRFFDNKHYPRGFSRHGDFTIKEAQLLERHGYAFNELTSVNASLQQKKNSYLLLFVAASVSQSAPKKKSGLNM
ncbi:hypothetical protein DJ57_3543 [Yersinia rochesterensis]|nr:hypothetical protein DJ57_3543 [Yersinia rochesterensis]